MLGSRFDFSEILEDLAARSEPVVSEAYFAELERDMADVAREVHSSRTLVRFGCPVCDEPMRVRDERDLSEFGGLDVKLHKLECDSCGMLAGRAFHPSIGYHTHLVR